MRLIGNLLWLCFGGFALGVSWWIAGLLMAVSLVGIPWCRSCFVLGSFCFFPFGREAISRKAATGRDDLGTGLLGLLGNVVWFAFAGLWLAVAHVLAAIGCAITIIGIPFAIQHLKLAGCALAPVGKTIVDSDAVGRGRGRAKPRRRAR